MNLLIIQARMGSSRLPGKVLKTIKGETLLAIQQKRIKGAKLVDRVVIATTTDPGDDAIERWCRENGTDVYRGSEQDVLDRYYQAAKPFAPQNVIRVTSDCPLHHRDVVDFAVSEFIKGGWDYFSNSNFEPQVLEDGFDTEVFTFAALEEAWRLADKRSEREHVTPYIKNSGRFRCGYRHFMAEYRYKLSVDTLNDFKAAEAIFGSFPTLDGFGMPEVVALLEKRPELAQINSDSVANAGYKKSLEQDNDKQ